MAIVVAGDAQARGGICLRVAVDQEDFEPLQRQAGGKIDRGGSFAHTTLLVYNAENLSHGISG